MWQQGIGRAALFWVLAICGVCGCGTTGSDPILYPEVRFKVRPSGQATFRVTTLSAGDVRYVSVIGQQFTATAGFDFAIENAPAPYVGAFEVEPGSQITVTLVRITGVGQTEVTDATGPGKPTAMVSIGSPLPSVTPRPSDPEVRFDVCAPLPGGATCSTATGDGSFGVLFSGSLGDPFVSHLTSGATPTIYFYQAPQNNINAVLTRLPVTGALLGVQLFINGQLKQTAAGSGEVILSQDL